ncbi:MAG: beta strand repeat-containing protein [Acidimicrobiia bacterium]
MSSAGTTLPGAPTSLSQSGATTSSVTVTFTAGASNGAAITNYQYSTDDGSSWCAFSPVQTGSPVTVSLQSNASCTSQAVLVSNTRYSVRLRAVNAGGAGTQSAAVSAYTQAAAPYGLSQITATPSTVQESFSLIGNASVTYQFSTDGGTSFCSFSPSESNSPVTFTRVCASGSLGAVLSANTNYSVQLRAQNAVGAGVASSSFTITTLSTAPTSVVQVGATASSVSLSFTAPSGTATLSNYRYSTDGGSNYCAFSPAQSSAAGATVSVTIATQSNAGCNGSALTINTAYTLQLKAVSIAGVSAQSSAITVATLPGAPTSLAQNDGASSPTPAVNVTFSAPTGTATMYNYQYSTDGGTTFCALASVDAASPITIDAQSDAGCSGAALAANTTYSVKLKAVNTNAEGAPNTWYGVGDASAGITVTTPAASPAITTLTPGDTQVSVVWSAPGGLAGITSYVVTAYSNSAGSAVASVTAPATNPQTSAGSGLTYTFTGLSNGTAYYFRVAAINAGGTGASSAVAGPVVPRTVPDAPTGVFGLPGSGQVSIGWLAPSWNGGDAISDYVIQYKANGAVTWTTFTDAVSTTLTSTITGLYNGTVYDVRVAAVNAAGTGAYGALSAQITPTGSSPLVTVSGNAAAVAWSGGVNVSNYLGRYRSPATTGTWTSASSVTSPWAVTSLTLNATYDYTVFASNGTCVAGTNCPSVTVSAVQTLNAPTGVAGTLNAGNVGLTWTSVANATGYTVWRSASNDATTATQIATSVTASYTDVGPSGSIMFYYWVRATVSGTQWSTASDLSTPAAGVLMATAPSISGLNFSAGATLQPTVTYSISGSVGAIGGMGNGNVVFCLAQAATSAAAESSCGTSADAVFRARWTLSATGWSSDSNNANGTSSWFQTAVATPSGGQWTGDNAWSFSTEVTIGKAARAGEGWYLVVNATNSIGNVVASLGPKTMASYFEMGSVSGIDWGTVNPGSIALASASDPNGNNVPTAAVSAMQSRTVSGIWANSGWGLSSRITSFSSTSGWSLAVRGDGTSPAIAEFAMRCSALAGEPADAPENYLATTAKDVAGVTAQGALTSDAADSRSLNCQLLNGSAQTAQYTGTVIMGIGPN